MGKEDQRPLWAGYVRSIVDWLWTGTTVETSPVHRTSVLTGRVCYIALKGFIDDLCLLRASALAFASTVALVPSLAIAFAALRGLGWRGERLEALILSRATVLSSDAIETVVRYIDNTNFAGLGVVGGFVLLVTVLSVMANIEQAFNAIWGNATPRSPLRRVTDYFGVMILSSVLLAVAASATVVLARAPLAAELEARWGFMSFAEHSMRYGAYALVWFVFAFFYVFMPNTKVRIVPALVGGVLAGTVWQLTQWGYIRFQAGMSTYNAIYGTLAQLPVLMAWLFVSWLIVLFGAEIAYAIQNLRSYSLDREARTGMGRRLEDYVALGLCAELARASAGGHVPATAEALAEKLSVSPRLLTNVLERLRTAGVVHSAEREQGRWFLSLAPQSVAIEDVLAVFEGSLPQLSEDAGTGTAERVRDVLGRIGAARKESLAGVTLAELATAGALPGCTRA
jgi:membrane protein